MTFFFLVVIALVIAILCKVWFFISDVLYLATKIWIQYVFKNRK